MANNAKKPSFFIHDKAICDSNEVGAGTRIWPFAHVLAGAIIGQDCNICESVFVESNVKIGNRCTIKNGVSIWEAVELADDVFIGPNAVFTNDLRPRAFLKRGGAHFLSTKIEIGATIGANATLVCGITVGQYAMVGAGSVVISDVGAHELVVGNPARVIAKVCFCGEKLTSKDFCNSCKAPLSQLSAEKCSEQLVIANEST